jgi:hypothetical protein
MRLLGQQVISRSKVMPKVILMPKAAPKNWKTRAIRAEVSFV